MQEKYRATIEERAFPVPVGQVHADMQGLSLRDWFAGQAIQGEVYGGGSAALIAKLAYELAVAMMEARKTLG